MKTRILVLGTGMASLSALFELTSRSGWNDRFEIVVLQQGWRAGGKCASGRDPANHLRNYEHGLHILGGFYHNTFQMLRACYDEWQALPLPSIDLQTAFHRHDDFFLMQRDGGGFEGNYLKFPDRPGEPGVEPTELSPLALLKSVTDWITELVRHAVPDTGEITHGFMAMMAEVPEIPLIKSTLKHLRGLVDEYSVGDFTTETAANMEKRSEELANDFVRLQADLPDFSDLWILAELAYRVGKGIIADKAHLHGFDVLDRWDSLEWLERHGASDALLNSTYINSGYDYAFAFIDGEPSKKDFAAGVAVRGFMRMLATYHDAPFFHMRSGMGEAVIKPIFEVLRARGVEFRYFHRVTGILPEADGLSIGEVSGRIQARVKRGASAYEPLATTGELRYWPVAPLFDQLEERDGWAERPPQFESWWYQDEDDEEFRLSAGKDFDIVLSGIPIAALKPICKSFSGVVAGWDELVAGQKTSPTIAVQYWMGATSTELGSEHPDALVTGFALPASTWADMSFLLDHENYQTGSKAFHLSYACGPFPANHAAPDQPDPGFDASEQARATAAEKLWNQALRTHILTGMDGIPGLPVSVHVQANVSPSELYALSAKGSVAMRPTPDGLGLGNFFVVGDWTRNGANVGAVEAAVTSGFLGARAISGFPQYVYGETDFP